MDFIIKRSDVEFLKAVESYEGDATTTQIRQQTDMNRNQVNHRFERLSDAGFITVGQASSSKYGGEPPKIAQITKDGREMIEIAEEQDVVDYDTTPREVVDDIESVLEEIQSRLDALEVQQAQLKERLSNAPARADTLDSELEYHSEWTRVAERKIQRMESELEELRE